MILFFDVPWCPSSFSGNDVEAHAAHCTVANMISIDIMQRALVFRRDGVGCVVEREDSPLPS